jgi:hypothetical protein
LGVVRLSTTCPKIFTFTGATMTSESASIDDEYIVGVIGGDDAYDGEDESVLGDSEGGESDEPRKKPRAVGGRTTRISDCPCPWCPNSWVAAIIGAGGVFGRRPKSERVNARLECAVLGEPGGFLIIG